VSLRPPPVARRSGLPIWALTATGADVRTADPDGRRTGSPVTARKTARPRSSDARNRGQPPLPDVHWLGTCQSPKRRLRREGCHAASKRQGISLGSATSAATDRRALVLGKHRASRDASPAFAEVAHGLPGTPRPSSMTSALASRPNDASRKAATASPVPSLPPPDSLSYATAFCSRGRSPGPPVAREAARLWMRHVAEAVAPARCGRR